jgi:hypothetical protein
MKRLLILSLLMFTFCALHAQDFPDSLKIEKDGWSYYQNDYRLDISDLIKITADNENANRYIRAARTDYIASSLISSLGGGLIGYPVGKFLYTGKINFLPLIIGGTLVCVSIYFSTSYYSNLKKGVDAYNKRLAMPKTSQLNLKIGQTSNGFGIALRF